MKRVISLLVCLLLCVGMVPLTVAAADNVIFTVQTVEKPENTVIKAGETFDITVSISAVEALSCIECKLRYDKTVLTPVSSEKQGYLNDCIMADVNIAPAVPHTNEPDTYGEVWLTGLSDGDRKIEAEQVIAKITFKANADLSQSTLVDVFMTPIAAASDMTQYTCEVVNGGVKFAGSDMPETRPTMVQPTIDPNTPLATVTTAQSAGTPTNDNTILVVVLVAGAVALGIGVAVYAIKTKKQSA